MFKKRKITPLFPSKKPFAAALCDGKIIIILEELLFVTKEDLLDIPEYRLKFSYPTTQGYQGYDTRKDRDDMFDKILEKIRYNFTER